MERRHQPLQHDARGRFRCRGSRLIGNPSAYNEAFNICGDETPSFNDVLDCLSELTGKIVKTVDIDSAFYAKEVPQRAGEILGGRSIDSINSNEKIKAAVPSYVIADGNPAVPTMYNVYWKV